jgi:competence protein ComEC
MSSVNELKLLPAVLAGALLPFLLNRNQIVHLGGLFEPFIAGRGFLAVVLIPALILGSVLLHRMNRRLTAVVPCMTAAAVFLLTAHTLDQRLAQRLDPELEGRVAELEGYVNSLPVTEEDFTRFTFSARGFDSDLLAFWSVDRQPVRVGEKWRLTVKLRAPRGLANFQGGSRELWFFTENIAGQAVVEKGVRLAARQSFPHGWLFTLDAVRESIREIISRHVEHPDARGIVTALAIADRSQMPTSVRDLLTLTGTGHLMAISGLHIGLAAVAGFWLVRLLIQLTFIPWLHRHALSVTWTGAIVTAVMYAALAGFGVSTQRALIMLTVLVTAHLTRRHTAPFRPLMLAMAAVLIADPFAPLRPGFWFSFSAVAALLFTFSGRSGVARWWTAMPLAQVVASVATLPVAVLWFQTISPTGLPANLFAIPWVSFIVVPLTLTGVAAMAVSDWLSGMLLFLAGQSALVLLAVTGWLGSLHNNIQPLAAPLTLGFASLAFAAGLLLSLPGGVRCRWLGAVPGLLILAPAAYSVSDTGVNLEFLDVGQGQAVIVDTPGHTILYDTGPGEPGRWDQVRSVIAPALTRRGARGPDRVILSHADLDHAGGLSAIMKRYPQAVFNGNSGRKRDVSDKVMPVCVQGIWWQWESVFFRVLHPSASLPYLGNDSSCVLSIRNGGASVLLTGDISHTVEDRLSKGDLKPHKVLQVPHHGSASSSSDHLIDATEPLIAIASAGYSNRFGMPHDVVARRYRQNEVDMLTTAYCGAVRVLMGRDGSLQVSSARRERIKIWSNPPANDCP